MPAFHLIMLLVPVSAGVFFSVRYVAYLLFARHLSRVHGLAGIEALRLRDLVLLGQRLSSAQSSGASHDGEVAAARDSSEC